MGAHPYRVLSLEENLPLRKDPVHGVSGQFGRPIVFVTTCTHNRQPILANETMHQTLIEAWHNADRWLVGRYVMMPDHVHFFATPNDDTCGLETWCRFWKRQFGKSLGAAPGFWQLGHWDTRMRTRKSYEEKWQYVIDNPVRQGLVEDAGAWPYQGEMNLFKIDN